MTPASATVHPHTRGEYDHGAAAGGFQSRFTPTRVGNTVDRALMGHPDVRFTPTRVGNTP